MSTNAIAVRQQAGALHKWMEDQMGELTRSLAAGADAKRLVRSAWTECTKNPKLLECDQRSWALALHKCAAWGLYPDSDLGHVYLIPRYNKNTGKTEVNAQRGYQGLVQLARNTGEISDIYAECVYEKDEFKYTVGLHRDLIHEPTNADDPGKLVAVYAVAVLKSGEKPFVVLRKRDIDKIKSVSQAKGGPWQDWEAEMWKKSAVIRLTKLLPKSTDKAGLTLISAVAEEERADLDLPDTAQIEAPATSPEAQLEAVARKVEAPKPAPSKNPEALGPCYHADLHKRVEKWPQGKTIVCPDCAEDLTAQAVLDAMFRYEEAAAQK